MDRICLARRCVSHVDFIGSRPRTIPDILPQRELREYTRRQCLRGNGESHGQPAVINIAAASHLRRGYLPLQGQPSPSIPRLCTRCHSRTTQALIHAFARSCVHLQSGAAPRGERPSQLIQLLSSGRLVGEYSGVNSQARALVLATFSLAHRASGGLLKICGFLARAIWLIRGYTGFATVPRLLCGIMTSGCRYICARAFVHAAALCTPSFTCGRWTLDGCLSPGLLHRCPTYIIHQSISTCRCCAIVPCC